LRPKAALYFRKEQDGWKVRGCEDISGERELGCYDARTAPVRYISNKRLASIRLSPGQHSTGHDYEIPVDVVAALSERGKRPTPK